MICNGHFSEPCVPKLKGQDIFQGEQLHSHDYRIPDVFTDQTVVIFGGGPTGLDLALEVSKTAKRVLFSHHLKGMETKFPNNVVQKPDVAELTERGVLFKDGTGETVDAMRLHRVRVQFPSFGLEMRRSRRIEHGHTAVEARGIDRESEPGIYWPAQWCLRLQYVRPPN